MPLTMDPALLSREAARMEQTQATPDKASLTAPILALLAGQGFDTATTVRALRRGGVEGNPVLPQNAAVIAAIKALMAGVEVKGMQMLRDRGHDKLAKALGYVGGGIGAAAGAHNLTIK